MTKRVSIFCADDHPIVLRGLFDTFDDFNQQNENGLNIIVAGHAATAATLLDNIDRNDVDVYVIDLGFESTRGDLSVIKSILAKQPEAKIVIFSMRKNINTIAGCYHAGAKAYVVKGESVDYLLEAIFTVANGHDYFMPGILEKIGYAKVRNPLSGLDEREARLFVLLAQNTEMSDVEKELGIAEKTINNIISTKIKPVLGVGRQGFRDLAIKMGIIEDIE